MNLTLIQSTSEKAGADIAAFVAMFFETFDSFKGRRFHLTGESYAVSPCIVLSQTRTFFFHLGALPASLRSSSA